MPRRFRSDRRLRVPQEMHNAPVIDLPACIDEYLVGTFLFRERFGRLELSLQYRFIGFRRISSFKEPCLYPLAEYCFVGMKMQDGEGAAVSGGKFPETPPLAFFEKCRVHQNRKTLFKSCCRDLRKTPVGCFGERGRIDVQTVAVTAAGIRTDAGKPLSLDIGADMNSLHPAGYLPSMRALSAA